MQYFPVIVKGNKKKIRNKRLSVSLISNLKRSFVPKRVIRECDDVQNSTVTYCNIRRKLCAFGQLWFISTLDYRKVMHARTPLKTVIF